jgi:nitroimidazol reductase NimA-like FMN-containing flavoprotein (pyridoxamine 5'-phosphate oxidase superfamily)
MHHGLVELTDHECYVHLAAAHLGRLALLVEGGPMIFPVHFALLGRDPVFRTEAGAKLTAVQDGASVCLEVDESDPEDHTGWSVVVAGRATLLTDPAELREAQALPLRAWVGRGDAFVRVTAATVTGRRVEPLTT